MEYAFGANYVNMITSRKSDQRPLLNLTIVYKDRQGEFLLINFIEYMRESSRTNAILLITVDTAIYTKINYKNRELICDI